MVRKIHPNDDANKSQSSNDISPTVIYVAALIALREKMTLPLQVLRATPNEKAVAFRNIVKTGHTHLQGAMPLALGQKISSWVTTLDHNLKYIEASQSHLVGLVPGETAVGARPSTHPECAVRVAAELASLSGRSFVTAPDKFEALATVDALVHAHGALKGLAAPLIRIVNGVYWLAFGLRCGTGEITVPENEPGLSIMPGEISPIRYEVLAMVCYQVMGSDMAMGTDGASGNFELNVCRSTVIHNFLRPARLLANGMASFNEHCVVGIEPNRERIGQLLDESLMLVITPSTHIGYDRAVEITEKAHRGGLTLKALALALDYLTGAEFSSWVRPEEVVDNLVTCWPARDASTG